MTPKALRVVTCFLEGVETSLNDLKNGVFLKNIKFIKMYVYRGSYELSNGIRPTGLLTIIE